MAWYEAFLFLLVALTAFTKQRCLVDATNAFFMPPNTVSYCACPDDQVTFNCTVVDPDGNQFTLWRIGGSPSTCTLVHPDIVTLATCGPGNVFTAQLGNAVGDCFSSNLSVVATPELDGTTIQCEGPLAGEEVGNTTLHIRVTPVKPVLNPLMDSSFTPQGSDVTVELVGTLENDDEDCPQDLTLNGLAHQLIKVEGGDFIFLGTGVIGESYNVSVSAGSCGQVNESATLPLNLIAPEAPMECTATPVYTSEVPNQLLRAKLSWTRVDDPEETVAPGLPAPILYYVINVLPSHPNFITAECSEPVCFLEVDLSSLNSAEYTVTIAAVNILGSGGTCNTSSFSNTTNIVVDVDPTAATVECVCPSGCSSPSSCATSYRGNSSQDVVEDESSLCDNGSIILSLMEPLNTVYYYEASVGCEGDTAIISGTFRTQCIVDDLVQSVSVTEDSRCSATGFSTAGTVMNGVVCYNGVSTDSVANYECDPGYEVASGNTMRICMRDGTWSGATPICERDSDHDSLSASAVAGIFVGVFAVTLTVGVVVGVVLYYRHWSRKKKYKPSPTAPPDTQQSQYENVHELQSIPASPPDTQQSQYENVHEPQHVPAAYEVFVPVKRNAAVNEDGNSKGENGAPSTARPVGRIELRENEAYGPVIPRNREDISVDDNKAYGVHTARPLRRVN